MSLEDRVLRSELYLIRSIAPKSTSPDCKNRITFRFQTRLWNGHKGHAWGSKAVNGLSAIESKTQRALSDRSNLKINSESDREPIDSSQDWWWRLRDCWCMSDRREKCIHGLLFQSVTALVGLRRRFLLVKHSVIQCLFSENKALYVAQPSWL